MGKLDESADNNALEFRVIPGRIVKHGNANVFQTLKTGDVVYSTRGGKIALWRGIRRHCQSFGMVKVRRVSLHPKGLAWHVIGTTGREMAFRVERNDVAR